MVKSSAVGDSSNSDIFDELRLAHSVAARYHPWLMLSRRNVNSGLVLCLFTNLLHDTRPVYKFVSQMPEYRRLVNKFVSQAIGKLVAEQNP